MSSVAGAEPALLRLEKVLINTRNPFYKTLTRIRSEVKHFLFENTLPYVEHGVRLVLTKDLKGFQDQISDLEKELMSASDVFALHYAEVLQEAEEKLGRLFNRKNYPDHGADHFRFDVTWPNLHPPEWLKQYPGMYDAEMARVRAKFDQSIELFEQAMAKELHGMITHLSDVLKPNADGTKKSFQKSTVTNFQDFFIRFKSLNVRSDSELDQLVDKATLALGATDAKELKGNADLSSAVANAMAEVMTSLETKVLTEPVRKVLFTPKPEGTPA